MILTDTETLLKIYNKLKIQKYNFLRVFELQILINLFKEFKITNVFKLLCN